jgi:hypothetical protein
MTWMPRQFETAHEVYAIETPGGEAAVAIHRGPYNRMNETHDASENGWRRMEGSAPGTHGRYTEIQRRIRPTLRQRSSIS